MRLIVQSLVLFAIAAAVGLGLTDLAVHHPPGFDTVQVGPWVSRPADGTLGGDPYALAEVAASGRLPLARGDGIAFTAATDDRGRTLDGACVYRIAGAVPSARVWTLAAQTAAGGVFANPASRFAFASSEVMRRPSGAIEIVTSPRARPGNWLPTAAGPLVIALRLYDTTIGVTAAGLEGALPTIRRVSCP
jgi:hypothetical protein